LWPSSSKLVFVACYLFVIEPPGNRAPELGGQTKGHTQQERNKYSTDGHTESFFKNQGQKYGKAGGQSVVAGKGQLGEYTVASE